MKKKKGALPIYIFTLVWLLCALALPLYRLSALLITAGLAIAAGVIVSAALRRREKDAPQETPDAEVKPEGKPETKPESPYSPEVEAIIQDGKLAMKEMGRLYASIPKPDIRSKINDIMAVSDKIVHDAIDDPSDVPQIRKFLDFYLPTTIKLLNAYDRMSAQGVSGENITGSMERIEDMLDTTVKAYEKQLDALFANQAADIQTDIDTLSGLLAREGLGGKGYLDLKDFMKQYEKQQKGSTSNG